MLRSSTLDGIERPNYLTHLQGHLYFRRPGVAAGWCCNPGGAVDYVVELKYRLSERWPEEIKKLRGLLCSCFVLVLGWGAKILVDSLRTTDSCGGTAKPNCQWALERARASDDWGLLLFIVTDLCLVAVLLPLCVLAFRPVEEVAKLVFGIEGYDAFVSRATDMEVSDAAVFAKARIRRNDVFQIGLAIIIACVGLCVGGAMRAHSRHESERISFHGISRCKPTANARRPGPIRRHLAMHIVEIFSTMPLGSVVAVTVRCRHAPKNDPRWDGRDLLGLSGCAAANIRCNHVGVHVCVKPRAMTPFRQYIFSQNLGNMPW